MTTEYIPAMDLLEELQPLHALAAAATAAPWFDFPPETDREAPQVFDATGHGFCTCETEADSAFIAAARNLLTPENVKLIIAALTPNTALPPPYAGMCALAALGRPSKDEAEDWRRNRVTGRHDDTFDAGMRHGRAELACELLGLVAPAN